MDFKDYYEILGVSSTADEKAIKQAYRQLARKHHPDVNPGNKASEEQFKTINEANQVLSDKTQRKKYDELRAQYQQWQQSGGRKQDFDWQGRSQPTPAAGAQRANPEDMEDLFGDDSPYSDFFANLFGRGKKTGAPRRPVQEPGLRRGRDVEYEVELTLAEAFQGAERLLEMDGGHRIKAGIPAGVRSGSRVRLAGQGEPGQNSGPAGDLYLIPQILPNPIFEREGDDLHMEVSLDIFTAIAGGEIRIPTLERALILTIPPRTNAGRSFRLRGKGMPHLGDPKTRGDLFARIRLVLPEALTDPEVDSIRTLVTARSESALKEVKV